MTNSSQQQNPIIDELSLRSPDLVAVLGQRDCAALLLEVLPRTYPPAEVARHGGARPWELAGLWLLNSARNFEALSVFWALYQQMVAAQAGTARVHKGTPLVWISQCYSNLGFAVHAKRYLMLTLCEDALREDGVVSPDTTGVYFRLVWGHGLPDGELRRYARRFFELSQELPQEAAFPEALLQHVDDGWLTEVPSPREASVYLVSPAYVDHLVHQLGDGTGLGLEVLAEYLMSCMPGCRTKRRQRSRSTDYDIVCSMDGFEVDFRSELGRYFVCECKDWASPAGFTVMAKFCRVLDSTKSRFGVLFSKSGLSGEARGEYAANEQQKIFQDRGIVIVLLDQSDIERVAKGSNLVQLLRARYEAVRLDLRASRDAG
jgi:hypothetical protein